MDEEEDKPGLFGGLMKQAKKIVDASQPHCELCRGTLMAGSLVITFDNEPLIICYKCIHNGMIYYLSQRKKQLEEGK